MDDEAIMVLQQRKRANQGAVLITNPGICHQTISKREAERLAVALTYQDAEIAVELVTRANLNDPPGTNFTLH